MSRYELRGHEPHIRVVIGWDRPLETYFAQVWDERPDADDGEGEGSDFEEEPLLWLGCWSGEVRTVEELARHIEPYAKIPPEVRAALCRDVTTGSPVGAND